MSPRAVPFMSAPEVRELRIAGTTPMAMPAPRATARAKSSTEGSTKPLSFARIVSAPGARAASSLASHDASTTPPAPPARPSRTLSVINCWVTCLRVAPSALRMLNSLVRVAARVSMRLAMLRQAMNRTHTTAAKRTVNGLRASATRSACSGTTVAPAPVASWGCAAL